MLNSIPQKVIFLLCLGFSSLIFYTAISAAPATTIPRQGDIRNTKHNLSVTGPGGVKATSETQVCVFCHTPHGSTQDKNPGSLVAPLWNRALAADATYTAYDSSSTQANVDANPGGSSKLCLSCHDGTIAVGNVNVLEGASDVSIGMSGTDANMIPAGSGADTGFTRRIGNNLQNDHPISFSFDSSKTAQRLADADGELRDPINPDGSHIAIPSPGNKPLIPLDHDGKVQCTSCHDPHVSGQDLPPGTSLAPTALEDNIKFLRGRRYQMSTPLGGTYQENDDIVCLACHDKLGQAWSDSVHADPTDANESYNDSDADQREFPRGIKVWQAACLNCHDTHTVEGARRLLREGTDSNNSPKTGGNSAIEETCYQCHQDVSTSVLSASNNNVPDIKTEFTGTNKRMPITSAAQLAGTEIHDIKDADFTEDQTTLGYNNLNNRHAECTDCHNPHRILKNSKWDGSGSTVQATHDHESGTSHSNEISGALYGTWGVEPIYGGDRKFGTAAAIPSGFTLKSGTGNSRVTAEYQICLKCHSNYAYADDGLPESNSRPEVGITSGTTPYVPPAAKTGTNSFLYYTNQAMEFQAHTSDQGEGQDQGSASGASATFNTDNHRSWHPVMKSTGRNSAARGGASNNLWNAPFNNNVGNQTMYCTDCHGADNGTAANSEPGSGKPWGPHGSTNNFILRGKFSRGQAQADNTNTLCFKCHSYNNYGTQTSTPLQSGFCCGDKVDKNGHNDPHYDKVRKKLICTWCHVAVPHGWKNKALLVNLEDIGPEVICRSEDNSTHIEGGCTVGQPIPAGSRVKNTSGGGGNGNDAKGYNNPPYYINARLRLTRFRASGAWREQDCKGSKDGMMDNMCDRGASY